MCTGNHSNQVMYVILGLMGLSKAVSDNQFHWITGKIPGLENICKWLPGLLYYTVHVSMRLVTYAFLAAYYQYYAAIFLPVQIALNFAIEFYVCQSKNLVGNVSTAFLSLVAPASFMGSNDWRNRMFCRWQCFSFAINLTLITTALNLLSYFDVIAINQLPLSASESLDLEPLRHNVMGWGGLFVLISTVSVSVLSGIFAYLKCTCCHNLQGPLDQEANAAKKFAGEYLMKAKGKTKKNPDDAAELEPMNQQEGREGNCAHFDITDNQLIKLRTSSEGEITSVMIRKILLELSDTAVSSVEYRKLSVYTVERL